MNEWQRVDTSNGLVMPWYTHPFLDELLTWDVSNWRVFEYGAGYSTLWWRNKAKSVISVDTSKCWCDNINCNFESDKESYLSKPLDYGNFDCIIIDGEPTEWRDECTMYALSKLKDGGILIIDNYDQPSVEPNVWESTNQLLKYYKCKIFKQPNHPDWKTAYWIKE